MAELPKIVAAGDRDVVHGTFIEGRPDTDLHVFYWAERAPVRGTSGAQSITFTVPRKPAHAGIDPYHLLLDRDVQDNAREVEMDERDV